MKYRTIVADPPWPLATRRIGRGGRRSSETEVPYQFMGLEEIRALPVAEFVENDAHLYLWATRRIFREGQAAEVARAWGFEPCGEIVWGLRNPGTGGGSLANDHEPVLLAKRGKATWPRGEPMGVHFWRQPYVFGPAGVPQKEHSAKPEAFYDLVRERSSGPYLELFARRQRLGWDTWGDEALCHVDLAGAA